MIEKNDKGEFALYDRGKVIGYVAIDYVDGCKVIAKHKALIMKMKAAAAADNVLLTLADGFRTWQDQINRRIANMKPADKAAGKAKDQDFLIKQPPSAFSPVTARPGESNHQEGLAYDFRVRDNAATKQNEALAYNWLVKHAIEYGFTRTVVSERWHWELTPGKDMFWKVPKSDPTWDGLV